jgi:LPXTG-site transpeptidase (sortase) family protein
MKTSVFKQASYFRLFIALTIAIFAMLGTLLYVLHLVPEELAHSTNGSNVTRSNVQEEPAYIADVLPARIVISSVGIDTIVNHPDSQNVEVLDQSLLSGAVYYPGSGSLIRGNAFVFGHSTGLAVVRNQAFKTFNNLKNVKAGDEIRAYGDDGNVYIYKAVSTELVVDDNTLVEFDTSEKMLTLSTCNTFGKKEERHVVKAVFVRVEPAS